MSGTAEVRFGQDGKASAKSWIRLTASTLIRCCTYDDHAPILCITDGPADITITNPGQGEVTADDVRFARELADAVSKFAAEMERHAPQEDQADADPGSADRAA